MALLMRRLDIRRRKLMRIVGGVVNAIRRAVAREILPVVVRDPRLSRQNAEDDDDTLAAIAELKARLLAGLLEQRPAIEAGLRGVGREVQGVQFAVLGEQTDLTRNELLGNMGVTFPSLGLPTGELDTWVTENVERVTGLAGDVLDDMHSVIAAAVMNGTRADDLAEEIAERGLVAESRADLIATDQIGKLYGQINESRQTDLGIERYYWRTVGDERVRPEHEERDGEIFSWSDPPEDGHPGDPVRCRCYADPLLPDELEQREAA